MGRGRGKGRKLTVVSHEDAGSGEEDKVPVQKRRGRPQKPLKVGIDGHEIEKVEDDDSDSKASSLSGKEMNHKAAAENGKKRKRNYQAKDKQNSVKEESSGASTKESPASGSSTPSGFRQTGSRRKSTPRRAAEAGVKIDIFFSIDTPTGWNQL